MGGAAVPAEEHWGNSGCQGINNNGLFELQQRRGSRLQFTWQVSRATRQAQVRQTHPVIPRVRETQQCVFAVFPCGSLKAGTEQLQQESVSPKYSKPRRGHIATCTCATCGSHISPVLSSPMRAFLEMHHKGLIVPEFFMSGKLFIFVFKENNSPFCFFCS